MKKRIMSSLFIIAFYNCSAQNHKLQVGYDASFHSFQDMTAALFYAAYTYNIPEKWGIQAEYHTAFGGKAQGQNSSTVFKNGIPIGTTSTNQVGRPLSAYPEITANQLGYKQLDPNDEHLTYNTVDLSALFNFVKKNKNEIVQNKKRNLPVTLN